MISLKLPLIVASCLAHSNSVSAISRTHSVSNVASSLYTDTVSCRSGFSNYSGWCVTTTSPTEYTYQDAAAYCDSVGAFAPSIHSWEDYIFWMSYADTLYAGHFWLDAYCPSDGALYAWRDGSATDYPGPYDEFENCQISMGFHMERFELNLIEDGFPANAVCAYLPSNSPTPAPKQAVSEYCTCALDKKFGMPDGWDPTKIWLDVVIILDTSEAMGQQALVDASTLIHSFFGTDDDDVLTTDSRKEFYTRVGLIAMSDKPQVIYNLNMTKADTVAGKISVTTGLKEIDVVAAFNEAQEMLINGQTPDRENTRQVIYYMTNSDPPTVPDTINQFKVDKGKIIVNNFVEQGGIQRPGLKSLASDGYYYSDIQFNYMATIQLFCKANCFCLPTKDSYAGKNPDPAVQASGGCFHAVPTGAQFSNARKNCDYGAGLIASIHDNEKGQFVSGLMKKAAPTSDYYWIGYSRTDAGWAWEDKSTNTYSNWAKDEPSTSSVAKCAYADSSTPGNYWGAGNCNIGFPFACEYVPCSVGNKNC